MDSDGLTLKPDLQDWDSHVNIRGERCVILISL